MIAFIFWLLIFSLPLSFEYKINGSLGLDLPDEPLMLITSYLFLAYCIYKPSSLPRSKWGHPLILFIFISLVWTLLTACFAGNSFIAMKFFLAKTWYAGAFLLAPLILYNSKKAILNTSVIITGSMLVVVIITLFRQQQHGFQFAFINDALHPFFRNHVNYSAMLVCMIPIGIALYRYFQNRSFKYFILISIIVSLIALGFSYSRGAWLALITGAVAWWLLKKRLLFAAYIIFIAISIGGLFWLKNNDRYLHYAHDYKTTIFHKDFGEHLVSTYKLKDVSTAERFYRWIAGVRMIKDNLITGYGPNNFYAHYKGYAVPAFKTWVSDNKEHSTVHNYFLLVTIEQGLPALIFLIILFGAMLYYAQLLYHRIEDPFYKNCALITGIIVTMILTVNFLSDLIETDKIGSLFFLSIAVLVGVDHKFSTQRAQGNRVAQR